MLGVTPVAPLPAHAPVPTGVLSPTGTGGAQGSHCPSAFALRKGFQGGTRAVGMPACKGVAVAPLGRGGIANVVETVELLGHTGDISLTNRLAGCCQGGSRPDPGHSICWHAPAFLQESRD